MGWSPPGFSVHGILQIRVLEWVAMPSCKGSSQPRDWTHVSCLLHWQVGSLLPVPARKPIVCKWKVLFSLIATRILENCTTLLSITQFEISFSLFKQRDLLQATDCQKRWREAMLGWGFRVDYLDNTQILPAASGHHSWFKNPWCGWPLQEHITECLSLTASVSYDPTANPIFHSIHLPEWINLWSHKN